MLEVYALSGGYLELTIVFGRDPAQWETLPRAPAPSAAG